MDIKTPLVSVIMPAYNSEQFIEEAISSVLKQSYPSWELIVINDGSTDLTEEKILQFVEDRIRYIRLVQNKGASTARNEGLRLMQGDLFCFLDADDQLPPNSLLDRVTLFEHKQINFVDGTVKVFNTDFSREIGEYKPTFKGPPLPELLHLRSTCFYGITWMVRKLPESTYFFDKEMSHSEDLWFYTKLSAQGGEYNYVSSSVYHQRWVSESASKNLLGLAKGYFQYFRNVKEAGLCNSPQEEKHLKYKIIVILCKISIRYLDPRLIKYIVKLTLT